MHRIFYLEKSVPKNHFLFVAVYRILTVSFFGFSQKNSEIASFYVKNRFKCALYYATHTI